MQTIHAVYENGVFRPLSPVRLEESQLVTLSVEGQAAEDLIDNAFLARHAAFTEPVPTLAEVRAMLSSIAQTGAEMIQNERDER